MLSEHIWSKFCGADARITVDRSGHASASGGLLCTAEDLARLGVALLEGRLAPAFAAACASDDHARKLYGDSDPHGSAYAGGFWVCRDGALMAFGIHGQLLWVDPRTQLAVVKLATSPDPYSDAEYMWTMDALAAIRDALQRTSSQD